MKLSYSHFVMQFHTLIKPTSSTREIVFSLVLATGWINDNPSLTVQFEYVHAVGDLRKTVENYLIFVLHVYIYEWKRSSRSVRTVKRHDGNVCIYQSENEFVLEPHECSQILMYSSRTSKACDLFHPQSVMKQNIVFVEENALFVIFRGTDID